MVPSLQTEKRRVKHKKPWRKSSSSEKEFAGTIDLFQLDSKSYITRRYIKICDAPPYDPCSVLVRLYATMGLHSYNLTKGKNLELSRVLRYTKTMGPPAASTYNIALETVDPSLGSVKTFETSVSEQSYGKLSLRCNFATPHGETKKSYNVGNVIRGSKEAAYEYYLVGCMPEMPSLNPFQNTNPFYLLKKSEVEENGWIRMYLDLAFATTIRGTSKGPDLSKLEIVEVAVSIDTDDELELGLGLSRVTNAVFYIRHMDRCKARIKKKDVDRVAIVRRIFNDLTGCFSLIGQIHSSQTLPKPQKLQSRGSESDSELTNTIILVGD